MREFTVKEQELIKLFIQRQGICNNVKIGDVLLEFYNAQHMKPIENNISITHIEQIEVAFWCNNKTKYDTNGFESKMAEAILLLLYLIETKQMVKSILIDCKIIGEDNGMLYIYDPKTGEGQCQPTTIYNIYECGKLWDLMSSVYVVNNSLVELAKYNFKSIEQRNFKQQLNKTNWSIGITAIAVIVSAIMPLIIMICSPDTDKQIEKIESAIRATRTEYPTKIEVSLPDTITVKDIKKHKYTNKKTR